MAKVKALIITGYGLNCEEETKFAFTLAGGWADIIHIDDLISSPRKLADYQIAAFPGGFAYGDDTGAGNAFAQKVKNSLWEGLVKFLQKDRLIIGICNGFQILSCLGLLPALSGKYGERKIALLANKTNRYVVRWVDVTAQKTSSPWLAGITTLALPIAHGEGKFYAPGKILEKMKKRKLIALKYFAGEICRHFDLADNPTGTTENIAGITDETGRIFGLMPHPERAIFFHQLPHFTFLKEKLAREGKKIPKFGPGLKIFQNAVNSLM